VTAGTDSHPDDPHVEALGTVRQVTPPPTARALSTLSRVDYEDAFLAGTGPAQDRTGEQWARAILEDAPMSTRNVLSRGWSAIGLRLGSTQSDRFVLGWEVQRSTPDVALLGASGRLGLSGELLFECQQHTLLFATFVQLENRIAGAHCGPESRPGTGRSCGTSSSRPTARNGARASHEPGHCHRPSRLTAQGAARVLRGRLQQLLAPDITWTIPGDNRIAGTYRGLPLGGREPGMRTPPL